MSPITLPDGQLSHPATPGPPSPHSGSPLLSPPSHLGHSLNSFDAQPIPKAGPMAAIRSAPAKFFPSRRSLRLAAKCNGSKKSSLQRAQDIKCKKIKLVRFAAKSMRPPSSGPATLPPAINSGSATPPPVADSASSPLVPESGPTPSIPPLLPDEPLSKDPAFPLTPGEIHQILATCGYWTTKRGLRQRQGRFWKNRVFRFLSWNVRGLNDQAKCTTVRSLIRNSKCSVVCLQETKLASICFSKFRSICGGQFHDFRTLDACGTRGGLLTTWNTALFDSVHCWAGDFSLNVVLKRIVDGQLFSISNVYGPTHDDLKPVFFLELRSIRDRSCGLWAAIGDFNVLLSLEDKNGVPTHISDILNFREVINDIGLIDVPLQNRSYTWSNGRIIPTLERLDRALISPDWFESFWLRIPSLGETITKAWNSIPQSSDALSRFTHKLFCVQHALQDWNLGRTSLLRIQAASCLQWIDWLDSAEERRNCIAHLSDGNTTYNSPASVANYLFSFFHNQLGLDRSQRTGLHFPAIFGPENINLSGLCTAFNEEEVKLAIFSCAPEKARGRTAFPLIFYQRFWQTLKGDILDVFNSFFSGPLDLSGINYSWICPIPKRSAVATAKDLRPISLIHSGLLKIDFERAFDNVDWDFLLDLLKARGFGEKWIRWINDLLRSSSTAVLLNGTPGASFPCRKGLRQGDPLSPLLFILCIDVLYRMLQAVADSGYLTVLAVEDVNLLTLQFADDVLIFFDGSIKSATTIMVILQAFSKCSGLNINYMKSALIPINLPTDLASSLATIFGCPVHGFPLNYLGLPLSQKKLLKSDYIPLIEKLDTRLAGWKGATLSRGGRLVLLNSVLTSIPAFFCSSFLLPAWVIKAMDKIRPSYIRLQLFQLYVDSVATFCSDSLSSAIQLYRRNSGSLVQLETPINRGIQEELRSLRRSGCWELWKERNRRLFDNKSQRSEILARAINDTITQWVSALGC
uniref:Reverse transcriptase domain-containing protein n=1 Tax=Ananas comosus var. bracteatus TaxID=296719 RepID=A0A6V7QNP6_ANACO|nr:unnamed protein product [Ananas comosus var. bracteatus]